jgi:anti-sigma regulatory factor (Ser/Thr protein kinase)
MGHVVHFYDQEETLALAVADFLGAGLAEGAPALVIATPTHTVAIARVLDAAGIDIRAARAAKQYVELDAQDLLSRFTVGGSIDPDLFSQTVPPLVESLKARGAQPPRAYGEMVDLLWRQGNVQASHDLEMLWNSVGAGRDFGLFCGYSSAVVDGALPDGRARLAHYHDDVLAGPSIPPEFSRRFEPTLFAAAAARRFVSDTLRKWGLGQVIPEAELVVSELATNAVVHTAKRFSVAFRRVGEERVRIEVTDSSKARPTIRGDIPFATSGRGLRIVSAVAEEWSVDRGPSGKTIWAVLAARPGHN